MATSVTTNGMTTSIVTQIQFSVKNTFIDVKHTVEPVRRSTSVPRTFKPVYQHFSVITPPPSCVCIAPIHALLNDALISDDSTNGSDKGVPVHSWASDSEQDWPDYMSNCTDIDYMYECVDCASEHTNDESQSQGQAQGQSQTSKVTLSLTDMVTAESEKVRAKLRTSAVPFKSARAPPAEVATVIASISEALWSSKQAVDVQMNDGGMGGATTIVANMTAFSSESDAQVLLSLVKDAMLNSAEQSTNTYIIGYGSQPFKNLDQLSFSVSVGCVPQAHQDTACWEMYEHGYCPRRSTCRWDHPAEIDMMRIIVMLKKDA